MAMTSTSVGIPRHIPRRNGLLALRRELIERIGLTALILALFAVALFAGATVRGYILTNHHIAVEPWAADRRAQFLIETTGAEPRLKHLFTYFPTHREAIPLKLKSASKTDDIAVCRLQSTTIASLIPSLPLEKETGALQIGKPVVTMGYPTGPDRLLALLPEKEAMGLMDQYGASLTTLLDQLAKRKLIRPLMTQGHITDLYRDWKSHRHVVRSSN